MTHAIDSAAAILKLALRPGSVSFVVIVTAHSSIDYEDLVERAQVVVDLRNATGRNGTGNGKVWKL